jgi:uncharacterized protein YcbX
MTSLTLSGLNVYPVKSLRGISVEQWSVGARGLRMDRELMLVDDTGRFVTQREEHRLALVATELVGDDLVLSAPGAPPHVISLAARSAERLAVSVWKDSLAAEPVGAAADAWLSRILDRPVRLVRFPDDAHRQVDLRFARAGDAVGFADGFSFLLTTEASLADLVARAGQPLSMARFRPNLVVRGASPYAEDGWRRLRIGPVDIELVKPCARCVITTIDPATGDAGHEPLRALARHRNAGGKVLFGWNGVHRGSGTLQVGDPVEIIA